MKAIIKRLSNGTFDLFLPDAYGVRMRAGQYSAYADAMRAAADAGFEVDRNEDTI